VSRSNASGGGAGVAVEADQSHVREAPSNGVLCAVGRSVVDDDDRRSFWKRSQPLEDAAEGRTPVARRNDDCNGHPFADLPGIPATKTRGGRLPPRLRRRWAGYENPHHSREEISVSATQIEQQLVKHIDEAYAMEQNVLRMLDGMIDTTDEPEIKRELEQHRRETEQHAERLKQRLTAHQQSPSTVREAAGMLGGLMKSVLDMIRQEKAGRNARDGFATEHLEIASYQLLERYARRAGDEETAEVARQNRADEERMAQKIAANWDKFAELSFMEEGVTA
jgi:ferritin-like metal-binding protein YciE